MSEHSEACVPAPSPSELGRGRTVITQILPPPSDLRVERPAIGPQGDAVAEIQIAAAESVDSFAASQRSAVETYQVHQDELDRGLLIGRYDRCQIGATDANL